MTFAPDIPPAFHYFRTIRTVLPTSSSIHIPLHFNGYPHRIPLTFHSSSIEQAIAESQPTAGRSQSQQRFCVGNIFVATESNQLRY